MTEVEKQWNMKYEQLVEFKRKTGHCIVPHRYEQDKSLGIWVRTQRNYHKQNKLRQDRKRILDEIGFAWNAEGARNLGHSEQKIWHQQYRKLVEFKRKNGHCMVPFKYKQDKSLGHWVSNQRARHVMLQDRKDLLDELEFVWRVREPPIVSKGDDDALHMQWKKQYDKLVEFKRMNGHCRVPQTASLGWWVSNQRSRHSENKMIPNRKKLLDELDLVWSKAGTLADRSSIGATDVRGGLVIGSLDHFTLWTGHVSNYLALFLLSLCRIRIRKRSRTVWVSQPKL
jgi:hypothetical protein